MPEKNACWDIPLGARPTVLQMMVGIHGPNDVRRYRFEGLWCVHLYGYTGRLFLDGQPYAIQPGYAGIMPPGIASETHFPDLSRHLFAHFTLPEIAGGVVPIPVMQDLGSDYPAFHQAFEQALGYYTTNPLRAEVRLWDILWQLAERRPLPVAETPRLHPAVQHAQRIIEMRLTEPIRVRTLAREVELSHNHLTRLFRAATGKTVTGYIQERRVQRARHLLIHSSLSIKAIAAEVGIFDLHLFNKLIRRILGAPPRKVRAHHGEKEG